MPRKQTVLDPGAGGDVVATYAPDDDPNGPVLQIVRFAGRLLAQIADVVGARPDPSACGLVVRLVGERATSAAGSVVAASTSVVQLLAANPAMRVGAMIYNDGIGTLYVKLGAAAALDSFTIKIFADSGWTVPFGYTGVITGIWDEAGGSAHITEFLDE